MDAKNKRVLVIIFSYPAQEMAIKLKKFQLLYTPLPLMVPGKVLSMRVFLFCFLSFSVILLARVSAEFPLEKKSEHASKPPRGWNSYDSFCWTISEEEFLQSAEIVSKRLSDYGYEYVVVDYLWYRRKVEGAHTDSLGYDVIDEWGRMMPDPSRWPSSRDGKGFTQVAEKVHNMGLKFGIHVMRGISTQAVDANTPILDAEKGVSFEETGRKWTAKDIGMKERACGWMPHGFMSVNTKLGAGRAFLRSLYQQYAQWGVDFVKHDCVFGDDLDLDEISYVSDVLRQLDRPILYSLSPGTSVTPAMSKVVIGLVNMYRITGDDWDSWWDVASHFDVSRDFASASMIGAPGLLGKSWPDLDMLPLGWLTDPGSNEGPHRTCKLHLNEQRTQMTLWSLAKSPLMFGGDVRKLDNSTYNLITHPILLEINSFSLNNMEFPYITSAKVQDGRDQTFTTQSGRRLQDIRTSSSHVLGLAACTDSKAVGWFLAGLEKICWKDNSKSSHLSPFCLFRRDSHVTLEEDTFYAWTNPRKIHSSAAGGIASCLDASPKRMHSSEDFMRGSFSPCSQDAAQIWDLNLNGTLLNSHSGRCLTVNPSNNAAASNSNGIRSWIATGRQGEIYVAFFNLDSKTLTISAKISDVTKSLPATHVEQSACNYREVWSGEEVGEAKEWITMAVEAHGCALFVLNCD